MGMVAGCVRRVPAAVPLLGVFALISAVVSSAQEQAPPAPAAALPPEQIDQLIAPIALYPDNLLGQVLTASTYPLEVVMAARWSSANPNVTGQQLEDAMQGQKWDPSVRALTSVPQVLQMMNDKIDWTQQVGELYLAQPDDIAASVQRLRAHADASGNLKSSEQVKVRRVPRVAAEAVAADLPPPPPEGFPSGPDYIAIEPVNPAYMYVPVYDPFLVYGVWPYPAYRPFYWSPPGYVSVGIFAFGAPIVVGAALWANYNWYSRRVEVNVVSYNRFNHANLVVTNKAWRHDPVHRGNIPYHNAALQQQFGKTAATHVNSNFGKQGVLNNNVKGSTGGTGSGNPKFRSVNHNTDGSKGGNNNLVNSNAAKSLSNSGTGKNLTTTNSKSANVSSNPSLTQGANKGGSGMGTPGGGIGPAMGGGFAGGTGGMGSSGMGNNAKGNGMGMGNP
jgi:hypothetical protein